MNTGLQQQLGTGAKRAAMACALALAAQQCFPQGPSPQGMAPGMFMKMRPVLAAIDVNQDGILSSEELKGASAALAKLDKNGDGQLSEDEVRPVRRGNPAEDQRLQAQNDQNIASIVEGLMQLDRNGDGKIQKNELPPRMAGMFDRCDLDKDGALTSDEIRKLAEAQAAPVGRPVDTSKPGPGGPGGGGSFMKMDPSLAVVDANQDGVIDANELAAAGEALLKLDKNSDGQLSEDEVRPAMGQGRPQERH